MPREDRAQRAVAAQMLEKFWKTVLWWERGNRKTLEAFVAISPLLAPTTSLSQGGAYLLAKCSGITQASAACKGIPIDGSDYCYAHHPGRIEERRRHGSKGGKRGGRGRPVSELARLASRFEELADKVLSGEVERARGAVAGQLLQGARACVRDGLTAREQMELTERLEALEVALEQRKGDRRWGA